ncbi:TRAP transporter small permease [Planococcus salinus]|nr:TRAP transporter small permease [Planococcus salinus]
MNVFDRIDRVWSKIEMTVLSVTTILMSLMLVGNAVSRYFFSRSWGFSEEIGQLAIVVLTFMGIGYAARKGMHIEMSGFFDLLPKKFQRILRLFIDIVSAAVMIFVSYLAFQYVAHLQEIGQVTTILRMPVYLVMAVVPLGFFIAFLRYLTDFIVNITGFRGKTES